MKSFIIISLTSIISLYFILTSFGGINNSPLTIQYRQLDANTISAFYGNTGSFNWNVQMQLPGFEWPRGSGLTARYASGIWLGARVGSDTLVAVAYYTFEYRPGYTDNNGVPQGQNDPDYRIYKLTYGVNNSDRQLWPNVLLGNSDQGAPVYFDSSSMSWRPLDLGSQTMFYRYTDSYPEAHGALPGGTAPLKADIKHLNFALDVGGALGKVIFQEFTIINRSPSVWNNIYITLWSDDDLGNYLDDKVACDSSTNLGYTYNGDNYDEGYYGANPPAVGFLLLKGASYFTNNNNDTLYICRNKVRRALVGYKDKGMSSFNWFRNDNSPEGDPRNFRETYRLMSGLKRDGTPWIHPNGYATKYVFSGDPVTGNGWIQPDTNDQRFMVTTGPINMSPGDTQVVVMAQIIARGTSNLNSITVLRQYANEVRQYYNSCYTSVPIGIQENHELVKEFRLYQNYPNPFNATTSIKFDVSSSPLYEMGAGGFVTLKVFDILGREVTTLVNEHLNPGTYETEWDASNYPSGVYFYTLKTESFTQTKRMVLIK